MELHLILWPETRYKGGGSPPTAMVSGNDAVAHAYKGQPPSQFLLLEMVGEPQLNGACLIEGLDLVGGQSEVETGELILELRDLPCSKDRVTGTGRWRSQATCAILRPVCSATEFTAARIRRVRCCSGRNSCMSGADIRPASALPLL